MPVLIFVLIGLTRVGVAAPAESPQVLIKVTIIQVEPGTVDGEDVLHRIERLSTATTPVQADEGAGEITDAIRSKGDALPGTAANEKLKWTTIAEDTDIKKLLACSTNSPGIGGDTACSVLAAPSILVPSGELAEVSIGRQVPYLSKQKDGSLIMVYDEDLLEGVFIKVGVGEVDNAFGPDELIHLDRVDLKIQEVDSRDSIEGVPFDVGKPVIRTRHIDVSMNLTSAAVAVLQWPRTRDDDPHIIVVLAAKCTAQTSGQHIPVDADRRPR